MGRSRGGLTTKVHALVDARGLPIRMVLTAGEVHDSQAVPALLEGLTTNTVLLADKGYDADWIRAMIEERDAAPNIPVKSNRKQRFCFSREVLLPHEAVPPGRNPIREARRQLPRHAQTRSHPPMAASL